MKTRPFDVAAARIQPRPLSSEAHHSVDLRGTLAATAAFLLWGIIPIYWKQIQGVSPLELIAHRSFWLLLFLLAVLAIRRDLGALRPAFAGLRPIAFSGLSGLLLVCNWTIYVWAVNAGYIIESSLGNFLIPLGNVALGFLLLHERLRPLQWTAIALAALGVALLLAIEPLDAIEWTPQAGIEPGGNRRWHDLYRRILAAGKSVQVL